MREVLEIPIQGEMLVGTRHVPRGPAAPLGVLFINFGYAPRDGHGGLAARSCEALATRGLESFRFDLPGVGDSRGPLPGEEQQFTNLVMRGEYSALVGALVQLLCERYRLKRLVLGCLCSTAVTALFVAQREPERIAGLLLLEPQFFFSKQIASGLALNGRTGTESPALDPGSAVGQGGEPPVPFLQRIRDKYFTLWGLMRFLTHEGQSHAWLPLPRKRTLDYLLARSDLPPVTNLPAVSAWSELVRRQCPMLVITAQGQLRHRFFQLIQSNLFNGANIPSVVQIQLENTNHTFTADGASDAVIRHFLQWVDCGCIAAGPTPSRQMGKLVASAG